MKPIKYDGDVPCFSRNQFDDYGDPIHYGYQYYYIIESGYEIDMTSNDYFVESNYIFRKIHRYSRIERFKRTLREILSNYTIPKSKLYIFKKISLDRKTIWNDVRFCLKLNKLNSYYNRIPHIISKISDFKSIRITQKQYQYVLTRFKNIEANFKKKILEIKYFPNIRFIILKIFQELGLKFDYDVPLLQTKRKLLLLEQVWSNLK